MSQTFEQRLSLLTPEFREQYLTEQKKAWDGTKFGGEIPLHYRAFALAFETPVSLGVHAKYFTWLSTVPDEETTFTISDAVMFCRGANRTYMEFLMLHGKTEQSAESYAAYIQFAEQTTKRVNDLTEPISNSLLNKMASMQTLQGKAGNRKIALA